MNIDEITDYLTKCIAEEFLRADKVGLRRTQTTAGVLMAAAESLQNKEIALRFRSLAAQAANKIEELDEDFR